MNLFRQLRQFYRCSAFYEVVSRWRGTSYAESMASDRSFFGKFFRERGIRKVFDVGANVGDKAAIFSEFADRVICIEADPSTASNLRARFIFRRNVRIQQVAVGATVGTAKLFRKNHSGFNTLSEKWSDAAIEKGLKHQGTIEVPVTTLDRVIDEFGRPDYIKIDVEGYELPTINGLSTAIRAISFEANIPTFLDETRSILAKLNRLQPAMRYNFRIMEDKDFHFSAFVDSETLLSALMKRSPFTCDVFAVDSTV